MIVEMSKVQVLGPRRLLPETLQCLHAQGILQLRSPSDSPAAGPDKTAQPKVKKVPLARGELTRERSLEEICRRLHELLLILPVPEPEMQEKPDLPDVGATDFFPALRLSRRKSGP